MARRWLRLAWLPATVLLMAAAAEGARKEEPAPDLSGTWKLNDEVTARLMQGMRDRQHGSGFGGSMGRRGGGGPGGGGPGGPGGPGGGFPRGGGGGGRPEGGWRGEARGDHDGAGFSFHDLDEVTIVQKEDQVTLTDGAGHARVLWTDGRKVKSEEGPGGAATVRARWEDGSLVVRIKPGKGPERTESWTITNDGKRLFLTLSIDGGPPVPLQRAYDRAEATVAPGSQEP